MKTKTVQSNLILLITAVIWGGGFVAQRLGMQQMGPYLFNGFRFMIGAITLVPVIIVRNKKVINQKGDLKTTLLSRCRGRIDPVFWSYIPAAGSDLYHGW